MSSADCLLSADFLLSHLEISNADSAQSKDVWNENLELLMSSSVCLLSDDCLLGQKLFRAAGHLENFPSCLLKNLAKASRTMNSKGGIGLHVGCSVWLGEQRDGKFDKLTERMDRQGCGRLSPDSLFS